MRKAARKGEPLEVHLKVFKPKQPHLQVLKEYPKVLIEEYWSKWEKKEYAGRGGEVSWIDADALQREANSVGIKEKLWVQGICDSLRTGGGVGG